MRLNKGRILRRLLRWTGRIPNRFRLLYPFWLAAQLDVVEEDRWFPHLPESMHGLRIAYASDIHFGPLLKAERANDLVDRLNAMQPDIMLLGGDYGEDTKTAIAFFEQTPPLRARLGVFAAIGNHDLMGTASEQQTLLDTMNRHVTVLRNAAVTVDIDGAPLCLCAVDDVKQGRPDFAPLLQPAQAAAFTIFMPHSPDAMPLAEKVPAFKYDMALAGHTHGGQLVLFGRSLHSSSRYGDRFRTGWMVFDERPLMVSNGVGTSLLPIRLGTSGQIHCLTLRRGQAE